MATVPCLPKNMTEDSPSSKAELQDALASLIQESHQNGVDIEGGYELRSPEKTMPDWDCVCVQLK